MLNRTTRSIGWLLTISVMSWGFAACGGGGGDGGGGGPSCGDGTVKENGECVPESTTSCGEGTTRNDSGECVPSGESLTCGNGSVAEGGECVLEESSACSEGTQLQDGSCAPAPNSCADGTEFDMETGRCIAVVSCGDRTNEEDGTCVPDLQAVCNAMGAAVRPGDDGENCVVDFNEACSEGTKANDDGTQCVPNDSACRDGDTIFNGKCTSPAEESAANAGVNESENNDPDLGGSANELQLGDNDSVVFTGAIESPSDRDGDNTVEQDVDVYTFTADNVGDWFQISLQSTGVPGIGFTVVGPNGDYRRTGSIDASDPIRQIAAPQTGEYEIRVEPTRTLLNDNVGPVGGDDWSYVGELRSINAPSPSTVDFATDGNSASGSVNTLDDNLFEMQGFQSGDFVELSVDALGDDVQGGNVQLWDGTSSRIFSKDVDEGDVVGFPFPDVQGSVLLLVDGETVIGPQDSFEFSASAGGANDIGQVGNDTEESSAKMTYQSDETKLYTFSVGAGQIIEISHENPGEDTDFEMTLQDSQLNEIASVDELDPRNDFSPDYIYRYTETGGTFILKVTNGEASSISEEQIFVRTSTPNDLGQAQPGDMVSGQLSSTTSEHQSAFYLLTLSQAAALEITSATNKDDGHNVIFRNASFQGFYGESIDGKSGTLDVPRAEAGMFLVEIEADEADIESNNLDINLSSPPPGEEEPNDSRSNAASGQLGETHVALSSGGSDVDHYQVSLSSDLGAEETLRAEVNGPTEINSYECKLLDSSGNAITERSEHDQGCVLLAGGLSQGDYYVQVEITESANIPYELDLAKETGTPESEILTGSNSSSNDSASDATALKGSDLGANGEKIAYGRLDVNDTEDYFSFSIGSQLSGVTIAGLEELGEDTTGDIKWEITDSNDNAVLSSSGDKTTQGIASGSYTLRVFVDNGSVLETSDTPENSEYQVMLSNFQPDQSTTNQPDATIPDDDSNGATNSISVSSCGSVQKAAVELDVSHESEQDLQIELTSPNDQTVILQSSEDVFGGSDFQTRFYPFINTPEESLSTFTGNNADGDWSLKIADEVSGFGDEDGTLNSWTLHLRCN